MTTTANLSPAFVQLFDSEVHQAYQGNAVLQNVCRMRTGVVGNTVNFPKIGKRMPLEEILQLIQFTLMMLVIYLIHLMEKKILKMVISNSLENQIKE